MPQILISTICIQVSVLLRTDSSPQSTACSPKPMCVRKVHHDFNFNNSFTATYLRKGFWPCLYFVRLSYVKLIPHVWPNRYLKILTPIAFPQKAEGQMTRRITTTDCVVVRRFLGFAGWFFLEATSLLGSSHSRVCFFYINAKHLKLTADIIETWHSHSIDCIGPDPSSQVSLKRMKRKTECR